MLPCPTISGQLTYSLGSCPSLAVLVAQLGGPQQQCHKTSLVVTPLPTYLAGVS
jgi:hypothetical protein